MITLRQSAGGFHILDHRHFFRPALGPNRRAPPSPRLRNLEDLFQLFSAAGFSSLAITGTSRLGPLMFLHHTHAAPRTNDSATMSTPSSIQTLDRHVFGGQRREWKAHARG